MVGSHVDDGIFSLYNRSFYRFAWVNGLFGELILQLVVDKPSLILKSDTIVSMQALVKAPVSLLAQRSPIVV